MIFMYFQFILFSPKLQCKYKAKVESKYSLFYWNLTEICCYNDCKFWVWKSFIYPVLFLFQVEPVQRPFKLLQTMRNLEKHFEDWAFKNCVKRKKTILNTYHTLIPEQVIMDLNCPGLFKGNLVWILPMAAQ